MREGLGINRVRLKIRMFEFLNVAYSRCISFISFLIVHF